MSVTGSGNFSSDLSDIDATTTPQRMGSDYFSAVTDIISVGNDGERYTCTASNGVSFMTAPTQRLRGYFNVYSFFGNMQLFILVCSHFF